MGSALPAAGRAEIFLPKRGEGLGDDAGGVVRVHLAAAQPGEMLSATQHSLPRQSLRKCLA